MSRSADEWRGYAGQVRREQVSKQLHCVRCLYEAGANPMGPQNTAQWQRIADARAKLGADDLARNAWLCERHADPEGYVPRLRASQEEARNRLLHAYPVCAGCGGALPPELVDAGQTRHERRSCGKDVATGPLGPLFAE